MVHSSPSLKRWGFLYIFAVHIGELRFNPHLVLFGGFLCHFYHSSLIFYRLSQIIGLFDKDISFYTIFDFVNKNKPI